MKLNKLWAGVLSLLALTACNKDVEPSQDHISTPELATKEVYADFSVGEGELRVIYNIGSNGKVTGLEMEDKDIYLYLAVRKGEAGTPVYQEKLFKKVPGENRATYSGKITVPNEGTGDYQISAMLLREEGSGGKVFAKVSSLASEVQVDNSAVGGKTALPMPANGKLEINVPYLSAWKTVNMINETQLSPTTIDLKPQGTILRFRIKNETSSPLPVKSVRFVSNAVARQAMVHFDRPSRLYPDYPLWVRADRYPPIDFMLPGNTIVPAHTAESGSGLSPWYYVWLHPTEDYNPYTEVYLLDNSGVQMPQTVFSNKKHLPVGSVPMTLTFKSGGVEATFDITEDVPYEWGSGETPKLALEYMAKWDINQAGDAFVKNNNINDPAVGRFTWDDAVSKFKNIKELNDDAGTGRYSMPTDAELRSVFMHHTKLYGTSIGAYKVRFENKQGQELDLPEYGVKIGDYTGNYLADVVVKPLVTYAIRFKDKGSNRNRTAFRYRRIGTGNDSRIEITCRYLGNDTSVRIADVAQDSYWTSNNSKDVVRELPERGYIDWNKQDNNRKAAWWAVDSPEPESGYSTRVMSYGMGASMGDHKRNKMLVRLWKRD